MSSNSICEGVRAGMHEISTNYVPLSTHVYEDIAGYHVILILFFSFHRMYLQLFVIIFSFKKMFQRWYARL